MGCFGKQADLIVHQKSPFNAETPRAALAEGPLTATTPLSAVPKTATYTRSYAERHGFLTLISDGQRITGAYALGPDAGEWLQQATVAIRARIPIAIMNDTIQPFPTFSEIYLETLTELTAAADRAAQTFGRAA